jgi:hypothetical protein
MQRIPIHLRQRKGTSCWRVITVTPRNLNSAPATEPKQHSRHGKREIAGYGHPEEEPNPDVGAAMQGRRSSVLRAGKVCRVGGASCAGRPAFCLVPHHVFVPV